MTTTASASARKPRRSAISSAPVPAPSDVVVQDRPASKLDQVQALLLAPGGATIAEVMAATGWQQHSVRGAIAGALKKRGLMISSEKIDGVRRYRASLPA
jgi:hypothetical protein